MAKKKTLFQKEMEKPSFGKAYLKDRREFQLEIQILQALEDQGLTYEEFANSIGSSKGNICRDLKIRGLSKASLERIQKMAEALKMEFVPLLLPYDPRERKEKLKGLFNEAA